MMKRVAVNYEIKYTDNQGNDKTLFIHTRSMAEVISTIRALRTRIVMDNVVIIQGDMLLQSDEPMQLVASIIKSVA